MHKLHKFFGLSAGLVILILSITGFLLDHDNWNFLYTNTFKHYPSSLENADKRLFSSYYVDPKNSKHILTGSKRGLYESFDGGKSFHKLLSLEINAIKEASDKRLIFATSDGLYLKNSQKITPFLLNGRYINAISIYKDQLVAVEDKKTIYMIDISTQKIKKSLRVNIAKSELQEDIKLSRFVRDLHYGRGLFDGDLSLLINDYAAFVLTLLGVSGFVIWFYIYRKKAAKPARKWIKFHANIVTIIAIFPVLILLITGVFLDHNETLARFMKQVSIPHTVLPPVYSSLRADIWSVDYDGKLLRVGNRYGVYKSKDLKKWVLESRGFGYSLNRDGDLLYVGGMGASNRYFDGKWHILQHTPHMFKDVVKIDEKKSFFSAHQTDLPLPKFEDVTLYSLLLSLHDGTFFSSWWIWVNDYASLAMLLLFVTGSIRWWMKKKRR